MPEKTLEQLRAEVRSLEAGKRKVSERKVLKKKIKALKFAKTKFGKVGMAITGVAEKLTRPAQRTPEGKVIAGTGGLGARVVEKIKTVAPAPTKAPTRQVSPMERTFAMPTGFGVPVKKKKKKAKPFDISEVIRGMPE